MASVLGEQLMRTSKIPIVHSLGHLYERKSYIVI